MGVIRTDANSAWRDYVTDGDPASGAYRPVKSDIRALFGTIDDEVAALQAGQVFVAGGPVDCATTANITLSGEQTLDGVLTSASRVLVKDQTAPAENGVYVSAVGAWARSSDMDAAAEVQGKAVYVSAGTANGGKSFATYSAVTTLGTDAIAFVQTADNAGVQDQIDAKADLVGGSVPLAQLPIASAAEAKTAAADKMVTPDGLGGRLQGFQPRGYTPSASLSLDIAFDIVNEAGERVGAITSQGAALLPGSAMLDVGAVTVTTDGSGNILQATSHDGSVTFGVQNFAPSFEADLRVVGQAVTGRDADSVDFEARNYAAWVNGGEVYASVMGNVRQLTADPANGHLQASIRGGLLDIIKTDNTRIITTLAGSYPSVDGLSAVEYVDIYGQSNAAGSASGAPANDASFNDRFLTFSTGLRTFGNALGHSQERQQMQATVEDATRDFRLGYEETTGDAGETAASGFAHRLLATSDFSVNAALLATCSAVGSASTAMLKKSATENSDDLGLNPIGRPWVNLEAKFRRAALFWRLQNKDFIQGPLLWNQGEGNINNSKASYLAELVEIRDDWIALGTYWNALRPATYPGHTGKSPLIVTQTCSGAHYGYPSSEVPWAQLQINVNDPTTALCAGPVYDQAYAADGVHLLSAGQEMQGARMAVAFQAWLREESYRPLHVSAAVRSGATVTLTVYNHFDLSLIFDTTTITGLGASQGFSWHDNGDGNAVSVSSVSITNSTTISITLSGTPTGTGGQIGIANNGSSLGSAGPTTGNRCSVRTNGSGVTSKDGRAVEHFLCIDRVAVTT